MEKKFYETPELNVLEMEMEGELLAGSGTVVALSADEPEVLYS